MSQNDAEYVQLPIAIDACDSGARRELIDLLKRHRSPQSGEADPGFRVEEVSEQPASFGAIEPSFWIDLVMKVPVSIAVTALSSWLCEVIKDARARRGQPTAAKESIHLGGTTITFDERSEPAVKRRLIEAIAGEIGKKKGRRRTRETPKASP
jgi:hypothetical protein